MVFIIFIIRFAVFVMLTFLSWIHASLLIYLSQYIAVLFSQICTFCGDIISCGVINKT